MVLAYGAALVRGGVILLLIYALLLAAGVGPYLKLYPRGGSFLSFDTLDHILRGIYCSLLALALFWGAGWAEEKSKTRRPAGGGALALYESWNCPVYSR